MPTRKELREAAKILPLESILGKTITKDLTPKQKRFARAVAEGATKADAYRSAYPGAKSPNTLTREPYMLLRDPRVSKEIEAYAEAIEAERYRTPAQLRALVIHQLTKASIDESLPPSSRLSAIKMLGQITEVAAFTERKEVRTISSSEDARAKVMSELKSLINSTAQDANIIERDADTLLAELSGAGPGPHHAPTPHDVQPESRADKHTIPHQRSDDESSDPEDPPVSV